MGIFFNSVHKSGSKKVAEKVINNCRAYKDLTKNQTDLSFDKLPITDKESYFNTYGILDKLYIGKELSDYYMVCASSGSTAMPTFWPRDLTRDEQAETGHTAFLDEHFQVLSKKTLIVMALDLGATTAGLMHTRLTWELSRKAKVSIATPGCRPEEACRIVENLYGYYDQVILLAYPTVVSDMIDFAKKSNFDVKKWKLKIGYTGAGANEYWRAAVRAQLGIELSEIVSFYGCTETGLIGMESKIVNFVISKCVEDRSLIAELFGGDYLPTVVDIIAPGKFLENVQGELAVTVDQPMPLVRYNVHDYVKFIDLGEVEAVLTKRGIKYDFQTAKFLKWLVVYGRNMNKQFTVDEVKAVIDALKLDGVLEEFQYREESSKEKVKLWIELYADDPVKYPDVSKLENQIRKKLSQKYPCVVSVCFKNSSKRIGYQSGKLRYLKNG